MEKLVVLSLVLCLFYQGGLAKTITSPISKGSEDVKAYWTPERLASAIPRMPVHNFSADAKHYQPNGPAYSTKAQLPAAMGKVNETIPLYPFPFTSGYAPTYTAYPYSAVGKLFFTSGGLNYVCSGGVVQNYIIYTAGHCVFDLNVGTWTTNIVFYPAYNDGPGIFGTYYAYQSFSRTEYTTSPASSPNEGYDIGIVVLQTLNGNGIGYYTGWFGAAWNYPYSQTWTALGYPQASPFNGLYDYYCISSLGVEDTNFSPNPSGIGCDTTGGASGGPWVLGFGGGGSVNQINSINVYKYNSQPSAIYGTYFGSEVENVYTTAVAVVPN